MPIGEMQFGDYNFFNVRPIFEEVFQQADQTTDLVGWTEASGIFTLTNLHSLQCLEVGELVYAGTALNTLIQQKKITETQPGRADLTIGFSIATTPSSIVEIRARRLNGNNFVGAIIDFDSSLLSIRQMVAGVSTTLNSVYYDWKCLSTGSHMVFFAMFSDQLFVVVDGFLALSATCSNNTDQYGFSIAVEQLESEYFPDTDITQFYFACAFQVYENPAPQLEDSADLMVMFRKMIKEQIEDPYEYDWNSYHNALELYDNYRNVGMPDQEWAEKGYGLEYPATEKWSVNATFVHQKFIFIPSSWSHWWVLPNLTASRLKPCTGFYVMGAGDNPISDEDLSHTQTALASYRNLGFTALPGFNPFYGTATPRDLSAWFLTATWQVFIDWMTVFGEPEFVLDFEPSWDVEPRYPDSSYLAQLTVAIQPLVNYIKSSGIKVHLIPGYSIGTYTLVTAFLNDPGASYFTDGDESQYGYTSYTAAREATLLAHQATALNLGFSEYRPGLLYAALNNATIQARFLQSGMPLTQWYWPNEDEAKIIGL